MHFNNMINRSHCALCFLLASRVAMFAEWGGGVALLQSTLDDGERCDWLVDIQSSELVHLRWSQMTVMIDLHIVEKLRLVDPV